MTIINISAVETISPQQGAGEPCLGCGIRYPLSNDQVDAYAFMIEGWVVGRNSPAQAVELISNAEMMARLPVNVRRPDVHKNFPQAPGSEKAAFRTLFNALRFPHEFDVELQAVFMDGNRSTIGRIRGERQPVRSSKKPAIQP